MKAFDNKYLKRIDFSIQLDFFMVYECAYTSNIIPVKYLIM